MYRNVRLLAGLTLLLAGLSLLVLLAGSAQAADSFTVDVSPTTQTGDPEDTKLYTITVENTGDNDDDYNLSITSVIPAGWDVYTLPTELSVKDGQSETATLYVEYGDRTQAEAGDTVFVTLRVDSVLQSAGTKNKQVTAQVGEIYGTAVSVIGLTTQEVEPDETVDFTIKINNTEGNGEDSVTFSHSADDVDGWSFTYDASAKLDPDEQTEITLSVTPSIDATAGLKSIGFFVTSEDGTTKSSVTVTVRVKQLPDLNVAKVGSSAKDVEAGKRVYYSFSVENTGNAVDDFSIEIVTGAWEAAGWNASLDTTEITNLGVGSAETLTEVLVVKAPENAAADDEATIKVRVKSQYNTSVFKEFISRSTVTQDYDPRLKITGGDTQNAEPDVEVSFTLNITNAGNGEDEITLELLGGNATWGSLSESLLILPAGVSEDVTLRVTAPDGTLAQNGYRITVRATAEDDVNITSRDVFLNVDQVYDLSVSVSGQTKQSGDPGDVLEYSILVKNKGNGEDTINLDLEGTVADWGSLVEDVDLDADESTTLTLSVTIDEDATFADYTITVNGTSDEAIALVYDTTSITITVNKEYRVDILIDEGQKSGDPEGDVIYKLRIQNKGTGTDTFRLSVTYRPVGWVTNFDNTQVTVAAGNESSVNLTVSIHKDADNLEFLVNVTAISEGAEDVEKYVSANATTTTTVEQRYEFRMTTPTTYIQADPDEIFNVMLVIENKGTGDDTIDLRVDSLKNSTGVVIIDWVTDIPPSEQVVENGKVYTNLTVTVSEDAVKESYFINVTGNSADYPAESRYVVIQIDVSQRYEVQMLPRTETRAADPDETITFDVIIKNKGTGEDTFDLTLGGEVGVSWGSLSEVSLTIGANSQDNVTLTVEVPDDAVPKDGNYELILNITSVDNDTAKDFIYRYIDVEPSVDLSVSLLTEFQTVTPVASSSRFAAFAFKVKNDGTEQDTFNIELQSSEYNKWATLSDTSVIVEAGVESSTITLDIEVPGYDDDDDVRKGDIIYEVKITSDADDTYYDWANLTLTIKAVYDVEINTDTTTASAEPGDVGTFDVRIKNIGNDIDSVALIVLSDTRGWVTFEDSGTNQRTVAVNVSEETTVRVLATLPDYATSTGQDRTTLEGNSYIFSVKATTGDGLQYDQQSLTTTIEQIYGANLTVQGENTIVSVPDAEDSQERQKKFTIKLKNLGNRADTIPIETVATSYPDEWTVGIFANSDCSVTVSGETPPGTTRTLYLCVTPDIDADPGNVTVVVEAKARNGAEEPEITSVILDVRDPERIFEIAYGTPDTVTLKPEENKPEKNTARFKIVITNNGVHDLKIVAEMDTILGDDWFAPTQTSGKDDWFYINNDPGSTDKWDNTNGETIEAMNSDPPLWIIVIVDPDIDEGNYTIKVTIKTEGGEVSEAVDLTVIIEPPERSLTMTPIDTEQEISPEYGGTDIKNRVKFKIKLENDGTHADDFIAEIESTLEDDWEVDFYQDSGHSVTWPGTGVAIDSGEQDDLWVFVVVDDETDEGDYVITISVRDKEDDPAARAEADLTVKVQRSNLMLTPSEIQLEVNGEVTRAVNIKSDDSVTILVNITNEGDADADNAFLEIYYYAKDADRNEDESIWLKMLYSKSSNIRASQTKQFASNIDWLMEEGEWYVEARIDYDEDDDNGVILETNENDNDARYSELLQIKPDILIKDMRIDSKWSTSTPNIDDRVTFTVTVENIGAADVDNARLYIFHDNPDASKNYLKETRGVYWLDVDIPALEDKIVRFRWDADLGEWSGFRAEINPKYDDVDETAPFDSESDHFIDELNRYTNNEYPTAGGVLTHQSGGEEVVFKIFPDFEITNVKYFPTDLTVDDEIEVTVTVSNTGYADWELSSGSLSIEFDDGINSEAQNEMLTESIAVGDNAEVTFKWTVPDEDKDQLNLKFSIDAGQGSFEIEQLSTENDDWTESKDFTLAAVVELAIIEDLKKPLIPGVPIYAVIIGVGVIFIFGTIIVFGRRRLGGRADEEEDEERPRRRKEKPEAAEGETPAEPAAVPSKLSLTINSTVDGKSASVKVPSQMPVAKLVQNCVQKFPLPHANFVVHLDGQPVDSNLSLADAGFTDGAAVELVSLE